MTKTKILDCSRRGRTGLVFALLRRADGLEALHEGRVSALQWLVHFGDVTALEAVLAAGGDLSSLDLDRELGHAASLGHFKVCDFLIGQGSRCEPPDDRRSGDGGMKQRRPWVGPAEATSGEPTR